jgi:hypothetical protein
MNSRNSPIAVDIIARDIGLTDSLRIRVNSKIGAVVSKLGYDAISATVVLKVLKFSTAGS